MLAALGVILALAVLFHPEPAIISTAVLSIASNLVAGALGAFAHAAQVNSKAGNAE
jgi:hypothetical protein